MVKLVTGQAIVVLLYISINMTEYELSAKLIFNLLREKNVEFLYHANTVMTSITFLKENALLSRHYIEANNLKQSPQKSDAEDKKFDVWDNIFMDGADLHNKYRCANKYGPVLFRMKLDILLSPLIQSMYVTKSNPWYWKDSTPNDQRYYSSIDDLKNDYLTGKKLDSQIMFTIQGADKKIKLSDFLHSIGLDEPKLLISLRSGTEKKLGDYAREKINETMTENGFVDIPLLTRHSIGFTFCTCNLDYNLLYMTNADELKRRFRPEGTN